MKTCHADCEDTGGAAVGSLNADVERTADDLEACKCSVGKISTVASSRHSDQVACPKYANAAATGTEGALTMASKAWEVFGKQIGPDDSHEGTCRRADGRNEADYAACGSARYLKFSGCLEEMLELLCTLPFGSVVDLQGRDVVSSGKAAMSNLVGGGKVVSEGGLDFPGEDMSILTDTTGSEGDDKFVCASTIMSDTTTTTIEEADAHCPDDSIAIVCSQEEKSKCVSKDVLRGDLSCQGTSQQGGSVEATARRPPGCSVHGGEQRPGTEPTSPANSDEVDAQLSIQEGLRSAGSDTSGTSYNSEKPVPRSWTPAGLFRCRSVSAHCSAGSNSGRDLHRSIQVPRPPVQWLLQDTEKPCAIPCLKLRASGITVRNGRLVLPPKSCLVVHNSADLAFEHVVVSGEGVEVEERYTSTPLIRFENSSVTLEDCTVSGCRHGSGVGVVQGACVTLSGSKVLSNAVAGVRVSGPGSVLKAIGCIFALNAQDGVQVQNAAEASLEGCDVHCNGMLGVSALDSGTVVHVASSHIHVNGSHAVGSRLATLYLKQCNLDSSHVGVLALACGTVEVQDCNVAECGYGANVRDGAQVRMYDCRLLRCTIGAFVAGTDTTLEMTRTRVLDTERVSAEVEAGAQLRVVRGSLVGSEGVGVSVRHSQSLATLEGARIGEHALAGVQVSVMAHADISGSLLFNNGNAGVQSMDVGTSVDVNDCTVASNGVIGTFVNKGGEMRLHGCKISCNGSSGAEVRDRGSRMHCFDTAFHGNAKVGVYVHSSGAAWLHSGQLVEQSACVLVGGRASVDIAGGLVNASPAVQFEGKILSRHLGRVCKAADAEPQVDEGSELTAG